MAAFMTKHRAFTVLFALFAFCACAQQNVVLIIADDLGTDYLGFYDDGLDTAKMPHIRSLLARGVRFKRAWSFPYCSEIRAAALTGRFPFRTGVGTVIAAPSDAQLSTSEITIGKLLKSGAPKTYSTANVGKWHLHVQNVSTRNYPSVLGYDHYAGNFSGALQDYFNWQKIVNGAAPVTVTNYATTEQTDDAIKWLGSLPKGQPFFLWQAYNAPHSPFHVPPAALHSVAGLTGTTQHIQQNRAQYFKAMVESMDTEIGRLLKWLDDNKLRDSTNIIFIGDNGDAPNVCQFPNPQRAKGTVYEAGVHVPMIVSGPAVKSPNRASDALVSTTDLFATILEMAGFSLWKSQIPAAKPVDAVSILPLLTNEKKAVRDWVFTEVFSTTPMPDDAKAIRDLDYKLIRFDDGREELYRISSDPFELTNLLQRLPLDTEARTHYLSLCQTLANLLGKTTCSSSVSTPYRQDDGLQITVSPNPTMSSTTLNINGLADDATLDVALFAASGKLLFKKKKSGLRVDVGDLAKGMYWVKITTEQGEWTRPFVVH